MIKVLFVCLGNICRSPLAEAIFNHKLKQAGLDQRFTADSAGTSTYHIGEPPDSRSVRNALENGVVISHSARRFISEDFSEFHYILAMDHDNFEQIKTMEQSGKIKHDGLFLIRSFQADREVQEVPDPYFGGSHGFQEVFEILDDCNERLIQYLVEKH